MSGTSVSEVHAYPSRPEGFEEPLFATPDSRRAVIEYLLEAPWLARASQLEGRCGESARSFREPVGIEVSGGEGRVEHTVEKGFAFLVERVVDLREALAGAEAPAPRAVPGAGAMLRARRRGRRAG